MQGRRRARELAVQFLYSLETRPDRNLGECLDIFISDEGFAAEENPEIKKYLTFLVEGVWGRRVEIDNMMRKVVVGWRPERMLAVDRAVLRVAIFEGFLAKKVVLPVAISEAVELACFFGTKDSGKFVNGVLGKMARAKEETPVENDVSHKNIPSKDNEDADTAAKASEITTDC
jgi:N utilization substance protein B